MARIFFMLFLICLYAPAARAAEGRTLGYELYMGGIKAFSADLRLHETADDYSLLMAARSDGLLKLFTTWQGTMETQGAILPDGSALPVFHKTVSVWPDNTQVKEMGWTSDGTLARLRIVEEGETSGLKDIDKRLGDDSVDILTASLAILHDTARSGRCDDAIEVFDGKRRFRIVGTEKGHERLQASRYNIYTGDALRCEFSFIPQGGDWHEKLKGWMAIQEEGHKAGARPTVWLARLRDGMTVPVKMQAKTGYGTFMMHLSALR
jgi:hypothetical protein